MGFWDQTDWRPITTGETDAESPVSEEMVYQIRENQEALEMRHGQASPKSTVTSVTEEILTDTSKTWATDEHNGRSLVMLSGNAAGQQYTIDDTTVNTITCTGDTLVTDGVVSTDSYIILYDLTHTGGHTHDDIDSANVVLADSQVTQAKLKTTTASVTASSLSGVDEIGYTGVMSGEYSFMGTIKKVGTPQIYFNGFGTVNPGGGIGTSYQGFSAIFQRDGSSAGPPVTGYYQYRYVQSSGEIHWVFMLADKETGKSLGAWESPEHPCFNGTGKPYLVEHPFPQFDPEKHDLLVINPTAKQVINMRNACIEDDEKIQDRCFMQVLYEDYEIDWDKKVKWPDVPVTVGLPREDWDKRPGQNVTPIKKIIPRPEYVHLAGLKQKEKE